MPKSFPRIRIRGLFGLFMSKFSSKGTRRAAERHRLDVPSSQSSHSHTEARSQAGSQSSAQAGSNTSVRSSTQTNGQTNGQTSGPLTTQDSNQGNEQTSPNSAPKGCAKCWTKCCCCSLTDSGPRHVRFADTFAAGCGKVSEKTHRGARKQNGQQDSTNVQGPLASQQPVATVG
jgi:hypothetical protein